MTTCSFFCEVVLSVCELAEAPQGVCFHGHFRITNGAFNGLCVLLLFVDASKCITLVEIHGCSCKRHSSFYSILAVGSFVWVEEV